MVGKDFRKINKLQSKNQPVSQICLRKSWLKRKIVESFLKKQKIGGLKTMTAH
jgi:hypothetical protein